MNRPGRPGRAEARLRGLRARPAALILTLVTFFAFGVPARHAAADRFIDERLGEDTGGIYAAQHALPVALGLATASCALWQGSSDRLGNICWKAGEGALASYAAAKAVQRLTRRASPDDTDDPGEWSARGDGSFPSGHVAFTTALVMPFVLEYAGENPWAFALLLFPAYEMVARVKARDHWQTDVLAGALLGLAVGAYEHHREGPIVLTLLPGGAAVGYRARF